MSIKNKANHHWRTIKQYGDTGMLAPGDLLQLERLFLAVKLFLLPLPLIMFAWTGKSAAIHILTLIMIFSAYLGSAAAMIKSVPIWKRKHSDWMRFSELVTVGLMLTIVHHLIGNYEYNAAYLLVIIPGVLTGGLFSTVLLLSLTFPIMLICNWLGSSGQFHASWLGPFLNAVTNEAVFFTLAFITIWLTSQSNRYRIDSEVDGLTGLNNHRHFYQELSHFLSQKPTAHISIILSDIDNFKHINDQYGHLIGDEVLRKIGRLLRETLPAPQVTARYGGEEFAFILCGYLPKEIEQKMEEIQEAVAKITIETDQGPLTGITMSYGVVQGVTNQFPSDKWVQMADQALYKAKHAGKNRVEYHFNLR